MADKKIKIALIGNMNNNHFTLMRYFRDLGYDAYLFPFADELDHFKPISDTFDIQKWAPYIFVLPFKNGDILKYLLMSKKTIRKYLTGFDYYVGSGFSAAYFYKAGLKLDIFIPYSVYIEFIAIKQIVVSSFVKKVTTSLYYYYQKKGLQNNTRLVVTADDTAIESCKELNLTYESLAVPCVYNGESYEQTTDFLSATMLRIKNSDLTIFSHVSHNYINIDSILDVKKNYILIEGFKEYIDIKKIDKPLLILTEYGNDVAHSKQLIKEYGIEDFVLWLPKMNRKELYSILKQADFGGGEYGGLIWGGTGWEFLAHGIPFFQYVNLSADAFERITNSPIPQFINTCSPRVIADTLSEFESNPQKFKKIGQEGQEWFNKYNGINLAKQYINLLKKAPPQYFGNKLSPTT